MDELWQRYRTFWTPVLIGVGVFLVGVIVVHAVTKDPEVQKRILTGEQSSLRGMKRPERRAAGDLRDLNARLDEQVADWATRLDSTESAGERLIEQAVDRALRAALLRGATDDEVRDARRFAARFDRDDVAAERAVRRFNAVRGSTIDLLRSGDPSVAFGGFLNEVWSTLRVRANRADMEVADVLGFDQVPSVNRATLPGRVATLALVAELADQCIRGGVHALDLIRIEPNVDPGQPDAFRTEWPVSIGLDAPYGAVAALIARLTEPKHAVTILDAKLIQPRGKAGRSPDGTVRFEARLAASVIRPQVDLALDRETQ